MKQDLQRKVGQFIPVQISSSTKLSNGEKKVLQKKAVKDKVLKIPRRYKCSYSVKDDANVAKGKTPQLVEIVLQDFPTIFMTLRSTLIYT